MSISIEQAAARGIERLRLSRWANPMDHIKISILMGSPGPWVKLYCPINEAMNGRDPVEMLIMNFLPTTDPVWDEYKGPLPDSIEYRDKAAEFRRP